jgi:hypothetical protein
MDPTTTALLGRKDTMKNNEFDQRKFLGQGLAHKHQNHWKNLQTGSLQMLWISRGLESIQDKEILKFRLKG